MFLERVRDSSSILEVFKTALHKAMTEPVYFSQQSCSMQDKQMNFCLIIVQTRPCTEITSNQCFYDFTKQLKSHSTTHNTYGICLILSNSHSNLSNPVHLKADFGIKKKNSGWIRQSHLCSGLLFYLTVFKINFSRQVSKHFRYFRGAHREDNLLYRGKNAWIIIFTQLQTYRNQTSMSNTARDIC